MIQLTFQPAFDPFHATFRLLRLRPLIARSGPLPRDHVRILDFFLLFPFQISNIRLMPKHRRYQKLAALYEQTKPYGEQPENGIVFNRMEPMQIAALETLAAHNLVTPKRLELGEVEVTAEPIPVDLAARIDVANDQDSELMAFMDVLASEYQLTGPNGLKDRTNLLEYRYDAV